MKNLSFFIESVLNDILDEAKFDRVLASNPDYSWALGFFKDLSPKYLDWVMKQLKMANMTDEKMQKLGGPDAITPNVQFIVDILNEFDELVNKGFIRKQNKDITRYPDIGHVNNVVQDALKDQKASEEKKKSKSEKEVIYEDDTYFIIKPESEGASCYYGKGTKWCISAERSNMFYDYRSRGYEFLFIINKKTNDKDAVAFNPSTVEEHGDVGIEIYDSKDKKMSLETFNSKHPAIKNAVWKFIGLTESIVHYDVGDVKIFTRPNKEDVFVTLFAFDVETYKISKGQLGRAYSIGRHIPDVDSYMDVALNSLRDAIARNASPGEYDRIKDLIAQLVGNDILSPEEVYVKQLDTMYFSVNDFYDSLIDLEEEDLRGVVDAAKAKLFSAGVALEKQFLTDWTSTSDAIAYMRRRPKIQATAWNVYSLIDAAERFPDDEDVQEIVQAAKVYANYFIKLHEENKDRLYSDEYNDTVRDSGYLDADEDNEFPIIDFNQAKARMERAL